ncbi:NUDIX hydrolase [Mycobacterium uberis]|uniref:NUDIX hydrolase n=1 Tax=Mycobacterium uberis TaxID=2162698 RepID=UPI003C777889
MAGQCWWLNGFGYRSWWAAGKLPSGKVVADEAERETRAREVAEELGLEATNVAIGGRLDGDYCGERLRRRCEPIACI